jgi:hypothetical protein
MPRFRKKHEDESARAGRLRRIPWAMLLQGTLIVGSRWQRLSAGERERVRTLLSASGGRVDRLSPKDRKELRKLADKLDLRGMGRELLALRAIRGRALRRR